MQGSAAEAGALLEASSVCASYGKAQALCDVNLSVARGECLAVLGSNGAGKSTLARCLAGTLPLAAGRLTFSGKDITRLHAYERARNGVVVLPEERAIFPSLTVTDNLRLATVGGDRKEIEAKAYTEFPMLAGRRKQIAGTLSGGEQQLLALACALARHPRILIADEPSLGLAPKAIDIFYEHVRDVVERGVALILIEQFVDRAMALADDVVVLRQGRVAWAGPAQEATKEILHGYL
jgi:branched-chain amino acid transport system ATP-binding protein